MSAVSSPGTAKGISQADTKIKPKVFIISMFNHEANAWYSNPERLHLKACTVSVPGLWKEYPHVYCTESAEVCQVITGMGLINAALTISSLLASPLFDLTGTYFLVAGVAGINPKYGTLGSVVLPRYAVQVDLQYEFDAREIPFSWTTGYVPQGSNHPNQYPHSLYGTEVFELNNNLRAIAKGFAETAKLTDCEAAREYRSRYAGGLNNVFAAATLPPSVIAGDVLSANTFFHGQLLSESMENTCHLFTNGKATYVATGQEDNGILAALHRGAAMSKIDFTRIIVLRTGCNFDRPPPGDMPSMPLHSGHGGFGIAVENLWLTGIKLVEGILSGWDTFEGGVEAENYVGDISGCSNGKPRPIAPA